MSDTAVLSLLVNSYPKPLLRVQKNKIDLSMRDKSMTLYLQDTEEPCRLQILLVDKIRLQCPECELAPDLR